MLKTKKNLENAKIELAFKWIQKRPQCLKFENNQVLYFFNQDSVIWKMTGFDAADFFKQNKQ